MDIMDSWAILKVDIRFFMGTLLRGLLKSLYRIRVLFAYQKCGP